MVDRTKPEAADAVSPKGPAGPSDPRVKVDAGEEHHLKQSAASLNKPDRTKPGAKSQREDQPLRHVNDAETQSENAQEAGDVPDDYVRVAGRKEMQMPPKNGTRLMKRATIHSRPAILPETTDRRGAIASG